MHNKKAGLRCFDISARSRQGPNSGCSSLSWCTLAQLLQGLWAIGLWCLWAPMVTQVVTHTSNRPRTPQHILE